MTEIKNIWRELYFGTSPEPIAFSVVDDPTSWGRAPRLDYTPTTLTRDTFEQTYEDLWNRTFAFDEWGMGSGRKGKKAKR